MGSYSIEQISVKTWQKATGLVEKPSDEQFLLPEKVIQFGTGALLRGLPDYFIDEANKKGIFNGRVVVIKSTGTGSTDAFKAQNSLYTICIRGLKNGEMVSRNCLNSSISRVIAAKENWPAVLEAAIDENIQIVISNTTEVGLQYIPESITENVPASFPGKLLACLYARFTAFNGSQKAGMVILPTELISNNGRLLAEILQKLADFNQLSSDFKEWLITANEFCNTLVDCIVPGYPDQQFREKTEPAIGYRDDLMIVTETYRLWAIEGDESLKEKLAFARLDNGIIITPDITKFKELKLRLLNGTHTLSCGLAWLAGFTTVKEGMANPSMEAFVRETMQNEIAPAIPFEIAPEETRAFAEQTLDRFRNPELAHFWISITMQYSSKMRSRCIPILLKYAQDFQEVPNHFSLGFAAYLLFSKAVKISGDRYSGEWKGKEYPIQDEQAGYFYELWQQNSTQQVVTMVLQNKAFWGLDLTNIPDFEFQVLQQINALETEDPLTVISKVLKH